MNLIEEQNRKEKEAKKLFDKQEEQKRIVKATQCVISSIHLIDKASQILSKHYLFDLDFYKSKGRNELLFELCKEYKVSMSYVKKVMD
jgi:hypothetical protein